MEQKQKPHYIMNGNYIDYTFSGTYHLNLIIYLYEIKSNCISVYDNLSKLYKTWKHDFPNLRTIYNTYYAIGNMVYDKSTDFIITLNVDKLYNNDMSVHQHVLDFYITHDLDDYSLCTAYDKKITIHFIDNWKIVSFTDKNFDTKIYMCNLVQQRRLFK